MSKNCKIKLSNGTISYADIKETDNGEYISVTLDKKIDYKQVEYIDFDIDRATTRTGEKGYYCQFPYNKGASICYFNERDEAEVYIKNLTMPIICVKNEHICYMGIITGMAASAGQVITYNDGVYNTFIRFNIDCEDVYEPIEMRIYILPLSSEYSDMARVYRNYQLTEGGFKPIKERLTPELDYCSKSLYVRIRNAWKPVPCTILEQTPENEPPVHVACTFKQVREIMDMYHKKGIKRAEFCLVGWNIKGHDGRWPQVFPVEPGLGSEDDLRLLFAHAEKLGYIISCHTNFTDSYSIAENFSWNDVARDKSGNCSIEAERWAGGRTYNICPEKALRNAKELLPAVKDLGFGGLHYIDVITATPPRRCYHKEHPVNAKNGAKLLSDVLNYARHLFGGSASEAGYDYSLKGCDYVLYAAFFVQDNAFCDKAIPFWQLVYNGIVMSNPFSFTVNATASSNKDSLLKAIEYNGRPAIYYYARFVNDGSNWIGEDDFTYEKNEKCADFAKEYYDIFEPLAHLQQEFMEKHEEISPNVFEITYSDNSIVTVDYNQKTYSIRR